MADILTLYAPGPIPGIPGESHGPGTFLVDFAARTIVPYPPTAVPENDVVDPVVNVDEEQPAP
jgi:hypothetical protein